MRCAMFSVMDHHAASGRGVDALYAQTLDQCVLAEALGYEAFWLAEHHFDDYGVVPDPALFLMAAAARTRFIRLGPAVAVLPFHDPLALAERYALLDRLSGGRLEMGVGSGYLKHEFEGFAIDGAEKRGRFDEALAILKQSWRGQRFSFTGDFYRVSDLRLNVAPLQTPPPLYVAVLNAEVAPHVGRRGDRLMSIPYASVDRLEDMRPLVEEFRDGWRAGGHGDDTRSMLFAFHAHVADSDAQARADAADAFDRYVQTRIYAKRQSWDDIWRSRLGLFGSVERVVDLLLACHDLGIRQVMFLMNFGALAPEKVASSMRLMATEVLPRVRARVSA